MHRYMAGPPLPFRGPGSRTDSDGRTDEIDTDDRSIKLDFEHSNIKVERKVNKNRNNDSNDNVRGTVKRKQKRAVPIIIEVPQLYVNMCFTNQLPPQSSGRSAGLAPQMLPPVSQSSKTLRAGCTTISVRSWGKKKGEGTMPQYFPLS